MRLLKAFFTLMLLFNQSTSAELRPVFEGELGKFMQGGALQFKEYKGEKSPADFICAFYTRLCDDKRAAKYLPDLQKDPARWFRLELTLNGRYIAGLQQEGEPAVAEYMAKCLDYLSALPEDKDYPAIHEQSASVSLRVQEQINKLIDVNLAAGKWVIRKADIAPSMSLLASGIDGMRPSSELVERWNARRGTASLKDYLWMIGNMDNERSVEMAHSPFYSTAVAKGLRNAAQGVKSDPTLSRAVDDAANASFTSKELPQELGKAEMLSFYIRSIGLLTQ